MSYYYDKYYKLYSGADRYLDLYYREGSEEENELLREACRRLKDIAIDKIDECKSLGSDNAKLTNQNVKLTNQNVELAKQLSSSYLEKPIGYVDTQTDENPCVCCLSNTKCILFVSCGHLCVCSGCSSAFKERRVCPICNTVNSGLTFVYQ